MRAGKMKVGLIFESILKRGLLKCAMTLPNGAPELRYAYHEVIEEAQHSLMFQEFVNRSRYDAPGLRGTRKRRGGSPGSAGGSRNCCSCSSSAAEIQSTTSSAAKLRSDRETHAARITTARRVLLVRTGLRRSGQRCVRR